MLLIQRYAAVSVTAILFGCAAITPARSPDTDRKLSDALEQSVPALVSSADYRSASKVYFQLATTRSRMNDTSAACAALLQSLSYYRKALAQETGAPTYELSSGTQGGDDGMQEIRAKFGCAVAQLN